MKHLHRLLALLTISVAIFSCQKEYSLENPTGSNTPTAQWEFKEAGVQFKGPVDTVSIDTLSGFKFLTINGRSEDGSSQITLQVFGADLKPGTYKTPFSLFAYIKAGNVVYQTDQTAVDSFTIVITKVDTTGVTGTFSGNALSGNSSKRIVDGKFNAVFKGQHRNATTHYQRQRPGNALEQGWLWRRHQHNRHQCYSRRQGGSVDQILCYRAHYM